MTWAKIKKLIQMKLRYAMGGGIATSVDYMIYFSLADRILPPVYSQMIAYSVSVVVNFLFQKKFVFKLNRSTKSAFGLSMLVSMGGLILSTSILYLLLNLHPFLRAHQIFPKVMTSGIVFFYNFYLKRYVFEKKFL